MSPDGRVDVVQLTPLPHGCITEHEFTQYMRDVDPISQADWCKVRIGSDEWRMCHVHATCAITLTPAYFTGGLLRLGNVGCA